MIDQQQYYSSPDEFLENINTNILMNKIYVYTPKGDIIDMPEGATPIDFAYYLHTGLGNKLSGAKINNVPVPINTTITTGDVVEIIVGEKQTGPSVEWLKFAKTPLAQKQIKQFFEEKRQ